MRRRARGRHVRGHRVVPTFGQTDHRMKTLRHAFVVGRQVLDHRDGAGIVDRVAHDRPFGDIRHPARRQVPQGADPLGQVIAGAEQVGVLLFGHRVHCVEQRAFDIPVIAVRLDHQPIGVGQHVGQRVGQRADIAHAGFHRRGSGCDFERIGHLTSPSYCRHGFGRSGAEKGRPYGRPSPVALIPAVPVRLRPAGDRGRHVRPVPPRTGSGR